MRSYNKSHGFTLLEILLVVAIIAILAGIVIVAINPAKQLGDARNAQRRADVATILSAVYQYVIDNNGSYPGGLATSTATYVSASTTCALLASTHEICKSTATVCTGYSDIGDDLAPISGGVSYVSSMPTDPVATSTGAGTGYYIAKLTNANNRILVCAPLAENQSAGTALDGAIGVSR